MTPQVEDPRTTNADRFAVAAGNASLLSIGYLLLRRHALAAAAGIVTLQLLVFAVVTASVVVEILVVLWWAAMVAHGWWLAGGRRPATPGRRARWIGIVPAVVILLVFGLLRLDAGVSAAAVDDARLRGDCPAAVSAQDGVWSGSRLANAPAAGRGDETVEVCAQLTAAQQELDGAFGVNRASLSAAHGKLTGILSRYPGHERMVGATVDGFVARLPIRSVCTRADVTEVYAALPAAAPPIDRLRTSALQLRPAALIGCGDMLFGERNWAGAETRYRQLLTEFPRDPLVTRARAGADAAAAERGLPEFCVKPFGYPAAPVPGPGLNRALFPGPTADLGRLPAEWRARGIADGALVVCSSGRERGSVASVCPYRLRSDGRVVDVTYRRIAIPVRVFEFRTGRVVLDTRVEIGGASCPPTISYRTSFGVDLGPGEQEVEASDADVDAALRGLLTPVVQR